VSDTPPPLTPELVVRAYCAGAFPMAAERGSRDIRWYSPDPRAILPLDARFKVRRSLARRIRQAPFRITQDQAFADVIAACAQPRPGHDETWINPDIQRVFTQLHHAGLAHSVEAWAPGTRGGDDQLVGGLYGVALGAAFFGESMFSRRPDASQLCLVHLVGHLRGRGFTLLDVQFTNPHLAQFGVLEMPREQYLAQLAHAIAAPARFCDDS